MFAGGRVRRAALITGSSLGIGREIARQLAEVMPVIVNYRSDSVAAEDVRDSIAAAGGEALVVQADVSDHDQVQRMFSVIEDKGYWIHTLVNNAGVVKDQIVASMTVDAWQDVIDCNLSGAFYCVKEAAQQMILHRDGVIINISSVSGLHGQAGQSNYSAAKAGLTGLTKSLAKELGRYNVRVNCVAPGFVETDMVASAFGSEQKKTEAERLKNERIPLRRFAVPSDIADIVQFLASRKASYITGQVVEVDGGLSI
jgi:3-oxoacyl-[acyl-carrier protein] reductase